MLQLADPRWSTLTHAYGSASDIPGLLSDLASETEPKEGYESEPWFSLWSRLCHQGDVYDASYAALPHIVDIACSAKGPIDFSFLQLPAAIEIARKNGNGPSVPPDLANSYSEAVARLMECTALHRAAPWDQNMLISAMCAQAVAKGHTKVAEAIMNLDEELITRLISLDFDA
ncbi:MAG: hypothetical protein ACFB03_19485 [Paracoccaceae bacterium]